MVVIIMMNRGLIRNVKPLFKWKSKTMLLGTQEF